LDRSLERCDEIVREGLVCHIPGPGIHELTGHPEFFTTLLEFDTEVG